MTKNHHTHTLFETSDKDVPESIKDRNGEVVLGLCKVCGRGEIELNEPCTIPDASSWQDDPSKRFFEPK